MDKMPIESTMNGGPLIEERLSLLKAALKHLLQGFSYNPTFGNPKMLIGVLSIVGCCLVHKFTAVQSRSKGVTQTLFKNLEKTLSIGIG